MNARTLDPAHHLIENEPYYEAVGEEIQLFEAAYRQQIPVLLKGPTYHDMSLDELKVGYFYSNGAYGRTWGVRQLAEIGADAETGEPVFHFKGIAGTCRRKKGHCSPVEFARWAKYQVALQENDWKRVGGEELTPAEYQEA